MISKKLHHIKCRATSMRSQNLIINVIKSNIIEKMRRDKRIQETDGTNKTGDDSVSYVRFAMFEPLKWSKYGKNDFLSIFTFPYHVHSVFHSICVCMCLCIVLLCLHFSIFYLSLSCFVLYCESQQ